MSRRRHLLPLRKYKDCASRVTTRLIEISLRSAMLPLMRVLEQGGKFIQCVKHGVETTGLASGPVRPPLKGLNKEEKRELEQVIRTLKTTIKAIRGGN